MTMTPSPLYCIAVSELQESRWVSPIFYYVNAEDRGKAILDFASGMLGKKFIVIEVALVVGYFGNDKNYEWERKLVA